MQFLKVAVTSDRAMTAGEQYNEPLPAVPMSHILFTFKCLNKAAEVGLTEVLAKVSNISIKDLGRVVFDMSMSDLYALNCIYFGKEPILANRVATDNATRYITLIIPFGRKLFTPEECYPARAHGDVRLIIDMIATETTLDGVIYNIEAVCLPDATPSTYMKAYTKSYNIAAGGENKVDLERGNKLIGLLMWSYTVPTGTAWTASIDRARLMADNIEHIVAMNYWEIIHGDLLRKCGYLGDHGAAYGDDLIHKYGFWDFDPNLDGEFLIETEGLRSFDFKFYAGDTQSIRLIPLEQVAV